MRHPESSMSGPVPPPGPLCEQYELRLALFSQEGLVDDEPPETEALREHLESCAHCQTVLALYSVQALSLRRSHSERLAGSPSFVVDIIARILEEPEVSRLPENGASEQPVPTPPMSANNTIDDVAASRLIAAQRALQPRKRPIYVVAAWLSPLVAVLLIAILAVGLFAAHHSGRSVVNSSTSLPYAPGVGFEITEMSMTSPNEGWAIAQSVAANLAPNPTLQALLHDHNGTWSTVRLAGTTPLTAISMVSATDGWAVGDNGLILHYDGHAWTSVASPTSASLLSIRMLSATDGWASGVSQGGSDTPLILHFDGRQWAIVPAPALALAPTNWPEMWSTSSIQTQPDGEVWALTTWSLLANGDFPAGPPPPNLAGTAILHYDGHQWQVQMSSPAVLLSDLSMDSTQDGWVVGIAEPSNAHQTGPSATPATGAGVPAVFYHYSLGRWDRTLVTLPTGGTSNVMPYVGSLTMVSPGEGWMLAATYTRVGSALHFTQGRWVLTKLPNPSAPLGWEPVGFSFQSDSSGWIFGTVSKTITVKGIGSFVTWAPLLLRYSGGAWSIALD